MNSRERVLARINGRPVDRIPNLNILMSATPAGILELLKRCHIETGRKGEAMHKTAPCAV
jgi:hypothetical protein